MINSIQELRRRTGVGIAKCKEALAIANGDIEMAIAELRKGGLKTTTAVRGSEGAIAAAESSNGISFVELTAESDFTVRNDRFQTLLSKLAAKGVELCAKSPDELLAIEELKRELPMLNQAFGERIDLSRVVFFPKMANTCVAHYIHGGGRIATAVAITGDNYQLAREVAIHIAAANPSYLTPAEIPEEVLARERSIAEQQLLGKPAHVIEKSITGKLNSFAKQYALSKQLYIRDETLSIEKLIAPHSLHSFLRLEIGQ